MADIQVISSFYSVGEDGRKRKKCVVKCYCGKEFVTRYESVSYGHTKSCGCRQREVVSAIASEQKLKHGHGGKELEISPEYLAWQKIKDCIRSGWRIGAHKVCHEIDARWDSFENFLSDIGQIKPTETVKRKDIKAPWCKDNCFVSAGRRTKPAPKINSRRVNG